ncbi:HAD family hydrolase [Ktedonosporobacter rubrisoli]|uniref:HAD family hydrolase n=1 Tax=Ktedonosporobacter rubrisoli TaxID=2509675 RepID=A0A4P6JT25_KTERU|nr:HAD family hydrolase [Ktedonosporobacter rubrisoli]QBD78574.1 HAD family hydrolase [Ktedonosporobacter rubrisoli]
MIRALVFDFDGLILDTELPELLAWQEVFAEYNLELPLEKWALCVGSGSHAFDVHSYLEEQAGLTLQREELSLRRRKRCAELLAVRTVLPGIEAYLSEARRLGLRTAVASSSSRQWVTGHLSRLGLLSYFEYIICGDEVKNKKPDPELYLAALNGLGVEAREAIALEDSPNGVLAAQRAGIFCVVVPNAVTGQLPLEHANLRLVSLVDKPLAELIKLVEDRQANTPELLTREG